MKIHHKERSLWLAAAVLLGAIAFASAVQAKGEPDAQAAFSAKLGSAMSAEGRPAADVARDANRKPVETLGFAGLTDEMDVLELVPGGAWYTQLLAPALRENGSLSVWVGIDRFADRLEKPGLDDIKIVGEGVVLEGTERRGIFDLPASADESLGKKDFDAVLTFRNLHNLTPNARAVLNRAVYRALRPGGLYLVVDHTRRHMEPDNPENWRRLDPVVAIEESLAAGFVFEAFSDLHSRADDELEYEVGRRSVSGNTDRFTLLFRKPR